MSCLGEHVVDNNFDVAQLWCDSPLSLITSSLQQLASQDSCPAAFVVPGDVLRHARPLSPDRALQTYTSFLSAVSSAFAPGCAAAAVPVISLGNNDFLQPYSGVGTLSPWLLQLVDVLPSTKNLSAVDRAVFVQTGCYTMDVFALNVRFVILNTNFWSAQNSNTQGTDKDPGGLIEWMQKQLQKAKSQGRKVWLLGHAPPGVDHYSKKDAWHAVIANNFYSVLSPFLSEGIVTQSFFGHEHFILERKIVPDRDDMSLLSGSVSPDKGNYPSVRLLDVDVATAKVVDLKNWYLPLGTTLTPLWSLVEQGSFIAQFGPLTLQNVTMLRSYLDNSAVLASQYAARAYSDTVDLCKEGCVRNTLCDMTSIIALNYSTCVSMLSPSDWAGTLGLVGGMIGLAFVVMTIAVLWRRRQVMMQNRTMAEKWTGAFGNFLEEDFEDIGEPTSDSLSTDSSEL